MRLMNNISSLTAWRAYDGMNRRMERSIEKLSSGLRITRAGDDVAGLAISERMRGEVRSLRQVMQNVQEEINLTQTAEGALSELSAMLLRGRELAVQSANGVWTADDRVGIDTEMRNILHEIDRITANTEFNRLKFLGGPNQDVASIVESLRRSWLANAEALISTHYGLTADDVTLKIVAEETSTDNHPAWVAGTVTAGGKLTDLTLHINMTMLSNFTLPNGGGPPLYIDRIVAHEMTHAVMARTMDFAALPTWFKEGTAEFIPGADERLAGDMARLGGAANVVNEIDTWEGTSEDYSAGYAAVKYLHSKSIAAGKAGIKDVMGQLAAGQTLDQALKFALNDPTATTAGFVADFKANGAAFIGTLNLADADVGAIGGGTAASVVPDTDVDTWDPLQHFSEVWPQADTHGVTDLFMGVNEVRVPLPSLATGVYSLGLGSVDLIKHPANAIALVDGAILKVTHMRTQLGALQNRLEHTYNATAIQAENLQGSESRIRDLDFAQEMAEFTRLKISVQTGVAMMAQANGLRRDALKRLLSA